MQKMARLEPSHDRVIVDENTGPESTLWRLFQNQLADRYTEIVFLKDKHPGIPDVEILDKVLGADTVLLTSDRVLHQKAIEAGFRSYTLNEHGDLTKERLSGIRPSKANPHSVHCELKSDYRYQESLVGRSMKATLADRDFKRLRTARRRIRSHFGSADAICQVSITVGSIPTRKGLLCGYVHRVAGVSGVKGLRASEGYCVPTDASDNAVFPLVFALRNLYLLQLDQIPVKFFILPPSTREVAEQLLSCQEPPVPPDHNALWHLMESLQQPDAHPCVKGPFFLEMNQKLKQLRALKSNEIKMVDFDALTNHVLAAT